MRLCWVVGFGWGGWRVVYTTQRTHMNVLPVHTYTHPRTHARTTHTHAPRHAGVIAALAVVEEAGEVHHQAHEEEGQGD